MSFDEATIRAALTALAQGTPLKTICAEYSVSRATVYRWKRAAHETNADDKAELLLLRQRVLALERALSERENEVLALKTVILGNGLAPSSGGASPKIS